MSPSISQFTSFVFNTINPPSKSVDDIEINCYSWTNHLFNKITNCCGGSGDDDYVAISDEASIVLQRRRPLILRYFFSTCLQLYLIDGDSEKECHLRGLESPETANFVACCDELVLLSWTKCEDSIQYGVFNPLLDETITVIADSPINRRTQPCGFFFHPSEKDYKILAVAVGVNDSNNKTMYEYQIYSLGSKIWRRIRKPYFDIQPNCMWKSNNADGSPALVNGALHWYVNSNKIMIFDTISEEFSMKPLPFEHELWELCCFDGFLVKRGDELCLFVVGCIETKMDVWVLQDYEKWSWCNKYVVDLSWDLNEFPLMETSLTVTAFGMVRVVGFYGDEVVVFWRNRGLFVYDLGLGRVERVWMKKLTVPRQRGQAYFDRCCGFASYVVVADDRKTSLTNSIEGRCRKP